MSQWDTLVTGGGNATAKAQVEMQQLIDTRLNRPDQIVLICELFIHPDDHHSDGFE